MNVKRTASKTILLFLISFPFSLFGYSQSGDKYRLMSMCTIHKDKEGSYVYSENWHPCDFILTIYATNSTATLSVDSKTITFILLSSHIVQDNAGDAIVKFFCKDAEGVNCGLILTTLSNSANVEDKSFVKIEYSDKAYVYKSISD